MARRLRSDWYLIVFSLAVAFALWAFVTSQKVAFQRKTLSVPLEVANLPSGLICIDRTEKVTVTVAGPREELAKLERERVEAHVNVARLGPGRHALRVKVTLPPGLKLLSVTPKRAKVVLERLMRKEMGVRVAFLGFPPEGARVVGMEVKPARVRVEGPASKVSRASAAVVLLETPSGSSVVETKVPVRILDDEQLPVRGLIVSPPMVMVRLSLRPTFASKTLPVHPQIVGSPAEGFEVVGVEASPNFVTVSGRPKALRGVNFVRTRPVDISGATTNVVRRAGLIRPPGADALSIEAVTVVVRIRKKPKPPEEQAPKAPKAAEKAPPKETEGTAVPGGEKQQEAGEPTR